MVVSDNRQIPLSHENNEKKCVLLNSWCCHCAHFRIDQVTMEFLFLESSLHNEPASYTLKLIIMNANVKHFLSKL